MLIFNGLFEKLISFIFSFLLDERKCLDIVYTLKSSAAGHDNIGPFLKSKSLTSYIIPSFQYVVYSVSIEVLKRSSVFLPKRVLEK